MAERILVVEDESKIARFLELELKHEGYEVEIAFDGRSGLERTQKGDIDLIILDLMLPVMSGIEVWENKKVFGRTHNNAHSQGRYIGQSHRPGQRSR